MADISAALVKELRDQTGAPMMDCKRALVETNGDIEAAVRVAAREGHGRCGASARTARRPKARSGTASATTTSAARWSPSAARPSRSRTTTSSSPSPRRCSRRSRPTALGPRRASTKSACAVRQARREHRRRGHGALRGGRRGLIAAYAHPPRNKLGVLVQIRGGSEDLARKIAMHIAASRPQWVGARRRPRGASTSEREIFANSDEVQSKPEQAREKIVEGMLNKRFFADRVLTGTAVDPRHRRPSARRSPRRAPRCWSSSGSR